MKKKVIYHSQIYTYLPVIFSFISIQKSPELTNYENVKYHLYLHLFCNQSQFLAAHIDWYGKYTTDPDSGILIAQTSNI